jgi:hypothetical protein
VLTDLLRQLRRRRPQKVARHPFRDALAERLQRARDALRVTTAGQPRTFCTVRPDSDIDLVLLTKDITHYADNTWADGLSLGELTRARSWGPITERRFLTDAGLEVEINISSPAWANVDPVDPGTRQVDNRRRAAPARS